MEVDPAKNAQQISDAGMDLAEIILEKRAI